MRIGYFTNQYPAVSHTFIRREIIALDALGVTVVRYALRPGADLVDPADIHEKERTHYILGSGVAALFRSCLAVLLSRPIKLVQAIALATKIGWNSDRGLLRNLAYVVEGAVLADWCRRDAVEHLHAHFGTNSAAIAMFASRISGISYSFTAHGPDEFERAKLLSLDVKLDYAAFVVCVSAFGRSQYMRWTRPELWRKIVVVHCGLDKSFLNNQPTPPPDSSQFVCIGRISEQKAQLILVEAVRKLRDEGIHCEVVLVGDGPLRATVESAIQQAQLQDRITITGWKSGDRIKAEIAAARAMVLPSFAENLPVVIMEAYALGRPVISTYIAGIPELVRPQQSGWLVPAGDEAALAGAMREALNTSSEKLASMGASGRSHVIEEHDSAKEAAKLKGLFEGCAPGNPSAP